MAEIDDFVKDDETVVETGKEAEMPSASETPKEPETIPMASYMAEKSKRQELEAQAAALQAQLDSQTEAPSVFDDEEGAMAHLSAKFDTKLTTAVRNISRAPMMALHDDYEAQEVVFAEMAKADPSLIARMDASGNPAKFAYDTAKNKSEYDAMQDMPAYRDKLKAEIIAEMKGKGEEIPASLATLPGNAGTDDETDDSLSKYLKRQIAR